MGKMIVQEGFILAERSMKPMATKKRRSRVWEWTVGLMLLLGLALFLLIDLSSSGMERFDHRGASRL